MTPGLPRSAGLIVPLESIVDRLTVQNLFPVQRGVELELGAGDGSFLSAYARAHPEVNFFGVERLLGRLRKIEKKAQRAGLENVRLFRIEAEYFTRYLLPAYSLNGMHIYFPDPWPKRKHWKNRLVNREFTEVVRQALTAGGAVHLRTDDAPYYTQMVESFAGNTHFERFETPGELLGFVTDFERGFLARGIVTLHASYRKLG